MHDDFMSQKAEKLGVGPILLGFFLFVVVGSGAMKAAQRA